jgi:hypothetical protein
VDLWRPFDGVEHDWCWGYHHRFVQFLFHSRRQKLTLLGLILGIALFTYHKYTSALHSAVPLDAHGNPLEEEDAEEVLAVVRSNTGDALYNEEGLRLLEDGGDIEVPVSALGEYGDADEEEEERAAKRNRGVRLLEEAAEGGHGDGEIGMYSFLTPFISKLMVE